MFFKNILLILIGIIIIFIQVHPFLPFGKDGIRPDLMLIFVIYIGLNFSLVRGSIICLIIGYCFEVLSGTNCNLYLLINVIVFVSIKLLQKYFNFDTLTNQLFLLITGLFNKYIILFLSFCFVYEYSYLITKQALLKEILYTVVLFPFVFLILNKIYKKSDKGVF